MNAKSKLTMYFIFLHFSSFFLVSLVPSLVYFAFSSFFHTDVFPLFLASRVPALVFAPS